MDNIQNLCELPELPKRIFVLKIESIATWFEEMTMSTTYDFQSSGQRVMQTSSQCN